MYNFMIDVEYGADAKPTFNITADTIEQAITKIKNILGTEQVVYEIICVNEAR